MYDVSSFWKPEKNVIMVGKMALVCVCVCVWVTPSDFLDLALKEVMVTNIIFFYKEFGVNVL